MSDTGVEVRVDTGYDMKNCCVIIYLSCIFSSPEPKAQGEIYGAFHLRTSVYLLRTLIPSFAHNSAYHLRTFFTPH